MSTNLSRFTENIVIEPERPRANSAPSVATLSTRGHVHYPIILNKPQYLDERLLGGDESPYSMIRSLNNGNTNSLQHGQGTIRSGPTGSFGSRNPTRGGSRLHQRRGTLGRALSISQEQKEKIELKCCRINVLLVIMQLCLGGMVTVLAFYMRTLTPSLKIRECPFWAGIPLLLAGVVGLYYCATDFAAYSRSTKAFVIKCACFTLSTSCIFLCMIAGVFPGILGNKIASFAECNMTDTRCLCSESRDPNTRIYTYEEIDSCESVITSVKDFLILQCSLNCIASGVCFWFVMLLWKSRYQDFYAGIRLPSHSVTVPSHHQANQVNHRNTGEVQPPASPIIGIQHTPGKLRYPIYDRHEDNL